MALQIVLLHNTLIKKKLKYCVQSFSPNDNPYGQTLTFQNKLLLFASLKSR